MSENDVLHDLRDQLRQAKEKLQSLVEEPSSSQRFIDFLTVVIDETSVLVHDNFNYLDKNRQNDAVFVLSQATVIRTQFQKIHLACSFPDSRKDESQLLHSLVEELHGSFSPFFAALDRLIGALQPATV